MDLTRLGIAGAPSVEISDLAYDARSVTSGALFFCVKGANADGHDLAGAAVAAGAVALVVERHVDATVPQVLVPSVRAVMGPVAARFFGDPSRELDVAAVTGTNGKTTTAFLLRAILEAAGRRPALLTNIERRIGGKVRPTGLNTPESVDLQRLFREMLDAGDRSCVMEATSIAGAQGRLAGTRFAVLVFTNLTQDHLDFHGTMEDYFDAKRALFQQAERAVVNVGDEWGRRLAEQLPNARTFTPDDELDVDLKLRGRFNRANALGAVWAAPELGVDEDAIRWRESTVGRSRPLRIGRGGRAVRGDRRLRPHARLARQRAGSGTRPRPRQADRRVRGGRRPRPGEAAADGPRGGSAGGWCDRDDRQPTFRRPGGDRDSGRGRQIGDRARPSCGDRDRAGRRPARGRWPVIAGKGADSEMEIAGGTIAFDDRAVAREVLS